VDRVVVEDVDEANGGHPEPGGAVVEHSGVGKRVTKTLRAT
jgi:hypothetical protein